MTARIVVTGTDTGIGKTVFSAALAGCATTTGENPRFETQATRFHLGDPIARGAIAVERSRQSFLRVGHRAQCAGASEETIHDANAKASASRSK